MINYNYAFLFYDVNQNRVNKVFKVCKKYLTHYQNSVFRGDITPSNLILLKDELENIRKDRDFICIVKMLNGKVFSEEVLGNIDIINGESLIL
ncbi:MAG: CRISPR-associated endonuclease Cas2 [Peptostreptococcaceae bacterium]